VRIVLITSRVCHRTLKSHSALVEQVVFVIVALVRARERVVLVMDPQLVLLALALPLVPQLVLITMTTQGPV